MPPIRLILLTLLMTLTCLAAGDAGAQDRPLTLNVSPSGVEADPTSRLDDLLARRERRNDYLFRSICRGCGTNARFSGEGSFDPAAALAQKPATPAP